MAASYSAVAAPSPPKRPATPPTAASSSSHSAGWCTSTRVPPTQRRFGAATPCMRWRATTTEFFLLSTFSFLALRHRRIRHAAPGDQRIRIREDVVARRLVDVGRPAPVLLDR